MKCANCSDEGIYRFDGLDLCRVCHGEEWAKAFRSHRDLCANIEMGFTFVSRAEMKAAAKRLTELLDDSSGLIPSFTCRAGRRLVEQLEEKAKMVLPEPVPTPARTTQEIPSARITSGTNLCPARRSRAGRLDDVPLRTVGVSFSATFAGGGYR